MKENWNKSVKTAELTKKQNVGLYVYRGAEAVLSERVDLASHIIGYANKDGEAVYGLENVR